MAQLSSHAVDPAHAMQLHASHSTPSLEIVALYEASPTEMAGAIRQSPFSQVSCPVVSSQQGSKSIEDGSHVGSDSKSLGPGIEIRACAAELSFGPVSTTTDTKLHESPDTHVSSPSFPIIVTGTPITPSLVITEPLPRQGSHLLFSPHEPTQQPESASLTQAVAESTHTPSFRLSRTSMNASQPKLVTNYGDSPADLERGFIPSQDHLAKRSISLGKDHCLTHVCSCIVLPSSSAAKLACF